MDNSARLVRTVGRVMRTHYPRFLFGLPVKRGDVPVFTYHEADPAGFAQDLAFLAENGYRTLGLEEYLSQSPGSSDTSRRVVLTFDDARRSFWEVGLPLLRQFKARATLFVPTYWVNNPPLQQGSALDLFMSWEQVRACAESGLVDVQAHAHRHALVFTSGILVDFASPEAISRYDVYDWPMRDRDGAEELGYPRYGAPVYRAAPLLSAEHRFVESSELARRCEDHVVKHGGTEFFKLTDWRHQLQAIHSTYARSTSAGYRMPNQEFIKLVRSEFERCRAEFNTHLGYQPAYLAYPWMLGSPLSLELARESGFKAAFGVALDYRRARHSHPSMPVFGRLKADWLRLLPGQRRLSLGGMIASKISGFGKDQNLAH
jgi:peptidoglycan/xylan/chitin deacetylase (PgdA/CDA1 family)